MFIYIHTYIYIYTYTCIYVYIYIADVHMHIYIYIYVCIHIRTYIYIYIHIAVSFAIWVDAPMIFSWIWSDCHAACGSVDFSKVHYSCYHTSSARCVGCEKLHTMPFAMPFCRMRRNCVKPHNLLTTYNLPTPFTNLR